MLNEVKLKRYRNITNVLFYNGDPDSEHSTLCLVDLHLTTTRSSFVSLSCGSYGDIGELKSER